MYAMIHVAQIYTGIHHIVPVYAPHTGIPLTCVCLELICLMSTTL